MPDGTTFPTRERPLISLLHTTARPAGWRPAYNAWMEHALNPSTIEYILVPDRHWFPVNSMIPVPWDMNLIWSEGPRTCCVDGWNTAARHSRGQLLVQVADDFFPPKDWDQKLLDLIPDLSQEVVVEVSTGGCADEVRNIVHCIITRPRYERLGYLYWPEYLGTGVDCDFTEVSRRDGCVLDARHLLFPHLHPFHGTAPDDEVYRWQYRSEAREVGHRVFERRKLKGFPPIWKGER